MSATPHLEATAALRRLAEAHGLATAYEDYRHDLRVIEPDVLVAILEALDVDVRDPEAALLAQQRAQWSEIVDPVVVAWKGRGALLVRVPVMARDATIEVELALEDGGERSLRRTLARAPVVDRATIDGVDVLVRRVPLPDLPVGYHTARVRVRATGTLQEGVALVMSAPLRAYRPEVERREFGVFAPLYALHSTDDLGIGHLGDLRRLLRWTRAQGGATVGTLPLLATFHDAPHGASPYSPISRLAWDELFLDLRALPEFAATDSARAALEAARLASKAARGLIDYLAVERAIWPALTSMAERAFEAGGGRRAALERFAANYPLIEEYARFRAGPGRFDAPAEETYRTHLYAQFAMDEQLSALGAEARRDGGLGLYLDLPVGTHPTGFDAWRFPEAFASTLDAGAPPDMIINAGQNWHFAPANPLGLRRSGYRYVIESLRAHLRYAGVLRLDHVMAMHRMYVIPSGGAGAEGTYLHYPSDELWAIHTIESHRARSIVFGEDLGTVPRAVRSAMRRHGIGGSHVLQYEVRQSRRWSGFKRRTQVDVASVNTHDMPPFAGWLAARDLLGLDLVMPDAVVPPPGGRERGLEARTRMLESLRRVLDVAGGDSDGEALLRAVVHHLGGSDAGLVLVSLADLLAQVEPQNVPGTTIEHPNWQRRLPLSLEEIERDPRALALLALLREARATGR